MYIITVTGDIIIRNGTHCCQGLSCYKHGKPLAEIKDTYILNNSTKITHRHEGDIEFTSSRRMLPFASYDAEGGIQWDDHADVLCFSTPLNYFEQTLVDIEMKLNIAVCDELVGTVYNGLFLEIYSSVELLLHDYLLYAIFNISECYDRAIITFGINKNGNIEEKLIKILGAKVYHKFHETNNLYKGIIGIELPEHKRLEYYLHKRNNISHRRGISGLDLMSSTTPTKKDLVELIRIAKRFGEDLSYRVNLISGNNKDNFNESL